MNYLVTLNINNHLLDNSRQSMLAACTRWGCKFVELTENLVGDHEVCFNKIPNIQKLVKSEKVFGLLYVDADVLIRSDAPNPFHQFTDPHRVYAVRDVSPTYTLEILSNVYKPDVIDPWLTLVDGTLQLASDFPKLYETCYEWFFNAGVFLCYPDFIQNELNLFCQYIPKSVKTSRIEQAMWNYILKCQNKVTLIDSTWNSLSPDISSGKMKSYIYHFTGFNWQPLRAALPTYDWTV